MNRLKTLLVAVIIALPTFAQIENLPMTEGKYKPTDESLKTYQYPEWFRDAKFGIWAHWGPQSVPGQSGWYARSMYISDYYVCENWEYRKGTDDY
jgi:alpha-L-fucosidase